MVYRKPLKQIKARPSQEKCLENIAKTKKNQKYTEHRKYIHQPVWWKEELKR